MVGATAFSQPIVWDIVKYEQQENVFFSLLVITLVMFFMVASYGPKVMLKIVALVFICLKS